MFRNYMNNDFPVVVHHRGDRCRINSGWEEFVTGTGVEFGDYVQFDREHNDPTIWRVQSSTPMDSDEE